MMLQFILLSNRIKDASGITSLRNPTGTLGEVQSATKHVVDDTVDAALDGTIWYELRALRDRINKI